MSRPQHKTILASELIAILKRFPKDTKVYISSDSEGNSFGTIDRTHSWGWSEKDNALAIYQFEDHLDDSEIQPIQHEQIMNEIRAEEAQRKEKNNA